MAVEAVEGSERPVREQFKKASIHGQPGDNTQAEPEDSTKDEEASNGIADDGDEVEKAQDVTHEKVISKKRSFDDVDHDTTEAQDTSAETAGRPHTRKRSRDSTAEVSDPSGIKKRISEETSRESDGQDVEHIASNGATARSGTPDHNHGDEKRAESAVEAIASPKTKRSRLQGAPTGEDSTEGTGDISAKGPASKVPPASGFANTSTTSPFGALARSKSPVSDQTQTSTSAFAASGFSALSSSSTSGFGAVGKSSGGFGSGGNFATGSKSMHQNLAPASDRKEEADAQNSTTGNSSTFGGILGAKSAFASASSGAPNLFGGEFKNASGFGGSGFGALGSSGSGGNGIGGGGLTTFASGNSTPAFGLSKATKPFGAPADENDNPEVKSEDGDESGIKSPLPAASDEVKRDERFFEQDLETGEENEDIVFQCRAKLYNWTSNESGKKEWKEHGLGSLKLNVKRDIEAERDLAQKIIDGAGDTTPTETSEENRKLQARFLMRADGSHRVVLNTPIKKEFKFGSAQGGRPQGPYILFMGMIDGKESLELLQLKMKQQFAEELYDKIIKLQEEM